MDNAVGRTSRKTKLDGHLAQATLAAIRRERSERQHSAENTARVRLIL